MFRAVAFPPHPLAAGLLALGLVLAPLPATAEGAWTAGDGNASARLNIRIVIPPVMRVLENSHPPQIDGTQPVEQRLVVLSNMKRGFCVTLRLRSPEVDQWQVQAVPEPGVTLQAAGQAYRLCSDRPGRYTMVLRHEFGVHTPGAQAMHWPVQTDISAI